MNPGNDSTSSTSLAEKRHQPLGHTSIMEHIVRFELTIIRLCRPLRLTRLRHMCIKNKCGWCFYTLYQDLQPAASIEQLICYTLYTPHYESPTFPFQFFPVEKTGSFSFNYSFWKNPFLDIQLVGSSLPMSTNPTILLSVLTIYSESPSFTLYLAYRVRVSFSI